MTTTLTEYRNMSDVQRAVATEELQKFLSLVSTVPAEDLLMFSAAVDAVWHDHLNDQAAYARLCKSIVGAPIGHRSFRGAGVIPGIESYEDRYGTLPKIWFTDAQGCIDRSAQDTYERTHTVIASWDCGPATPDPDGTKKPEPQHR